MEHRALAGMSLTAAQNRAADGVSRPGKARDRR
jgi:hypothetical protein